MKLVKGLRGLGSLIEGESAQGVKDVLVSFSCAQQPHLHIVDGDVEYEFGDRVTQKVSHRNHTALAYEILYGAGIGEIKAFQKVKLNNWNEEESRFEDLEFVSSYYCWCDANEKVGA